MRHLALPGLAVIAATGFGTYASSLAPVVNPPVRVAGLDAQESHAGVSLLGQFRSSGSAWMYLRTDLYLHNGVEMRPLSEAEMKAGRKADEAAEDGHEKLHEETVVTVVPPRDRDFRGIFGDIERATASYQDMQGHAHNNPEKALPLFRLMTWLDPQFITGWTMGATVLARDKSDRGTREALRFLHEGLKHNPQSVDLLQSVGTTLVLRGRRLAEAVPYFERARQTGAKHFRMLSDGEREALQQMYRWLALCYRDLGQPERMRLVAQEGLSGFPDDPVLARLLSASPAVPAQPGRKEWEQAEHDHKEHVHGPGCSHDHGSEHEQGHEGHSH